MSLYITKKQLSDALTESAMALSLALPELIRAVNQDDPLIAIKKLGELKMVTEKQNSFFANRFIGAMLAAFSENTAITKKEL